MRKKGTEGNKLEFVVYNRPGDIVTGNIPKNRKQVNIQLIAFIGHLRNIYNNPITYKSNNEYYAIERWYGIGEDNEVKIYSVRSFLGDRISDGNYTGFEESSLLDRPIGDYPNNTYEVNLLQDSYEEFLNNRREFRGNFHLNKERYKHNVRLIKLKYLGNNETNPKMKEGYFLHLMQKETPTLRGKRLYEEWCKANPRLFTNLIKNVYQTNDFILPEC